MIRFVFMLVLVACSFSALAAHHERSTFQLTCSNIEFAYQGNAATIQAVCLKADGTPNASSLVINGVSNQDGQLTQGSGSSSFQQSCGSIQIQVDGPDVTLYAQCRRANGQFLETSLPLTGIENIDGNLTYQ